MPVVVTDTPYRPVPTDPPRKRWTRAEYRALAETGLFEGRSYELVEGELIDRMGKKRGHTLGLVPLFLWLVQIFGPDKVNPETSIDVAPDDNPTSEPEPDLIVLNRSMWEIRDSNPRASDIEMVVEVSDSTLGFDLTRKADLYARAGIPEYWVLDVARRQMIVHRVPESGSYSSVSAYGADETVSPLGAPNAGFPVSHAFGPR
ncbi:MAG: Uma2 family endonuclease [Acidobacteriota bacterium]|nr:Uma2 family endonuclease [Acidobacteriota bacterium]